MCVCVCVCRIANLMFDLYLRVRVGVGKYVCVVGFFYTNKHYSIVLLKFRLVCFLYGSKKVLCVAWIFVYRNVFVCLFLNAILRFCFCIWDESVNEKSTFT